MVRFSDFELLYNTSKIPGTPLSILSKLTRAHLYPTSFEKMNVSLAAQLLSDSVVVAITYFSTLPTTRNVFNNEKSNYIFIIVQNFLIVFGNYFTDFGSGTKDMVDLINKSFDIMNGRCIGQGIKKGKDNWDFKKAVRLYILSLG